MQVPDPALVVLVGASGSGKSTWAAARYRDAEVVSADALRAVVGSGTADLDASEDSFRLLDQIVEGRTRRGLTVVIDTLGMDAARRATWAELAREFGLPLVAVLFDTPAPLCRARNASRERPIPAAVLSGQLRRIRDVRAELEREGWDVRTISAGEPIPRETPAVPAAREVDDGPRVILQVGRFPWGADPLGWLRGITLAAPLPEASLPASALMDHLIQIPQVGRAWDPIPEPWVTLGALAALGTDLELGTLCTPATFRAPEHHRQSGPQPSTCSPAAGPFCGLGAGWWSSRDTPPGALAFLPPHGASTTSPSPQRRCELSGRPAPRSITVSASRCRRPRAIRGRSDGCRWSWVAAAMHRTLAHRRAGWGDACNIPADLDTVRHKTAVLRRHCDDVGRPYDEVQVTVLDVAVVGSSREDTWARVERLRGRTRAADYAARHHAGEVAAHRERHQRLFEAGVHTVFLALPDLEGPEDVERVVALGRR